MQHFNVRKLNFKRPYNVLHVYTKNKLVGKHYYKKLILANRFDRLLDTAKGLCEKNVEKVV